jgi:hypothetical protein
MSRQVEGDSSVAERLCLADALTWPNVDLAKPYPMLCESVNAKPYQFSSKQ